MDKIASPEGLIRELRTLLAYAESKEPSRVKLAASLNGLADRTAAVKDLADLLKIAPDWYKKQEDIRRRQAALQQEFNKEWAEAHEELEEGTRVLRTEIHDALVKYFGKRVRKSDVHGTLLEVFVGPQAKVSAQISLTFEERPYMSYKLRTDSGDADIEGKLSPKNTVKKLLEVVKKADKRGYFGVI